MRAPTLLVDHLADLASIALAQWRIKEVIRTGPSSYPFMNVRGGPRAGPPVWGLSSAGRATESHSVGHRFDPDRLHQSPLTDRFGRAARQA